MSAPQLSTPVEVGRAAGHHWFSSLHRLADDSILCEVVASADVAQGAWPAVLYRTTDAGASWHRAADIPTYGPASVSLGPDRHLLLPYEQWPLAPGHRRNTGADGTVITVSGDHLAVAPAPVRFLDFPDDLDHYHEGELYLLTSGNILTLEDGALFTTLYGRFGTGTGRHQYDCVAARSNDGGFTWRYLSHVAGWRQVPGATEGPNESNTARLPDGRLRCVYRVGWGRRQHYHVSDSVDEGRSWTAPVRMADQWSVLPQLLHLESGALLLTGGRPGLMLWISRDGRGDRWQAVNLAAHHNEAVTDASLRFGAECVDASGGDLEHTTAYTGLAAVGPDEALISYDRLGNGWHGAPGPRGAHDTVFAVRVRLP